MKILIVTLGSRGDVQPYLALAVGLQQAGHSVTLAAPATFADWIRSYGVAAEPVRFNPQAAMQQLGKGRGGLRTLTAILRLLRDGMADAQAQVWEAAQKTDYFIQSATGMGVLEAADAFGRPGAFAYLYPFAPTRAWPMFWLPFRWSAGRQYNWLTHHLMLHLLWQVGGRMANAWRRKLGLPGWRWAQDSLARARTLGVPFLYGYSPSLLPKPADWDDHQHVTGYWFLDPEPGWQPPADLLRFLEAGPPPVYLGFGSMNAEDPERHTRLALRALELSGQRGLLLTGWGGLARPAEPGATDRVHSVDNVPHAWLFPRLAAVVHHGGAGTTAATLRAGVPGILTPFGGDQIAWADLVGQAGVSPRATGIQRLTPERLAAAIGQAVNDPALRARAAALGQAIRAEDGVARAVEIIERHGAGLPAERAGLPAERAGLPAERAGANGKGRPGPSSQSQAGAAP